MVSYIQSNYMGFGSCLVVPETGISLRNRGNNFFGVMGGFMQPQGHVQVIMNTLDYHLNPQAALDAPRWQWINGKTIEIEHSFSESIAQELARRGHDIRWSMDTASFD